MGCSKYWAVAVFLCLPVFGFTLFSLAPDALPGLARMREQPALPAVAGGERLPALPPADTGYRILPAAAGGAFPAAVAALGPAVTAPQQTGLTAVPPPGTTAHLVQRGQSLATLVHIYLPQTTYMTGSELEQGIRQANNGLKGNSLKPGQVVLVPGYQQDWREAPVPVTRDFEIRAIYLTGTMAGSARGLDLVRQWRRLGGNAVVFDVKDSDGLVNVPFASKWLGGPAVFPAESPLAGRVSPPIRNLQKYVRWLHAQNLHAIARIAIFRDEYLVTHHPELAVHSRQTGQPWRENGKLVWTDPSNQTVQEYNLALARYAAACGVDEVQFDYVRFPAEGDQKDARFDYEKTHPGWQRADVLDSFLAQAQAQLRGAGVLFSLDVFGVMAWQRSIDLLHTGQEITRMARHCDVLSPMVYPSHFFGMDGYQDPGDAPEHFIGESMERFRQITAGSGVVLRPWLQAFAWRTKTYSPEYILKQVTAAKAQGGLGFLFWNARNDYAKPFTAMPEMSAHPGRYFRGDELRERNGKTVSAAGNPIRRALRNPS
jgi:hypothetical protein